MLSSFSHVGQRKWPPSTSRDNLYRYNKNHDSCYFKFHPASDSIVRHEKYSSPSSKAFGIEFTV